MKSKKVLAPASLPAQTGLKGLVRSLLGLFEDPLPVSTVRGTGKYLTEVDCRGHAQSNLEQLCGGRSAKARKHRTTALVAPAKSGVLRVTIGKIVVGELKPKDARLLLAQMRKTSAEPFALSVGALIEGGVQKKGGKEAPFSVRLDFPVTAPKPKRVKNAAE